MVNIEIKGIEELSAKFSKVQRNDILYPPMERAVTRIHNFMYKYPPQKNPASRYKRGSGWMNKDGVVTNLTSEELGQKWTTKIERKSDGLVGKVGNNASYAPLVQSKQFQARIHRDWWQTDEDAINRFSGPIVRDFEAVIKRALQG